jgi:hypothetical protein
MSYITTENKEKWTADLAAIISQIAAIDAAMITAATSGTKSYSFDSGTGRQQETFNSPLELVATRQKLAATRDLLQRKLNGIAISRMQLRR